MTKFERAVFGVLELVDAEVISFSRAGEVLGLKIMQLRAYGLRRPKKSVIQADRERMMARLDRFGKHLHRGEEYLPECKDCRNTGRGLKKKKA